MQKSPGAVSSRPSRFLSAPAPWQSYLGRLPFSVLLLLWCLLSCSLLIMKAGSRDLWLDEIITYNALRLPWTELVVERYWGGAHSPVYFFLLKLMLGIVGFPTDIAAIEIALRVPSAFMMTGAGALLIHALFRIGERKAAVALAGLWLLWPLLIYFGHEARPYAMLLFFIALALWGILALLAEGNGPAAASQSAPERRSLFPGGLALWMSGIGSLGAAITIPLGIIAVVAIEAAALLAFRGTRLPRFWRVRCALVWPLAVMTVLLFVPAIMFKAQNYWTEVSAGSKLTLMNVWRQLSGTFAPQSSKPLYLLPFLLLATHALSSKTARSENQESDRLSVLFGTGALIIPSVLVLASLNTSLLHPRYFVPTLCFLLPLYALWLARQEDRLGMIVAALVAASTVAGGVSAYTKGETRPFHEVRAFFEKRGVQAAAFASDHQKRIFEIEFYLNGIAGNIYYERPAGAPEAQWIRRARPSPDIAFWVVQSQREFETSGNRVSWAGGRPQCSIRVGSSVVTLVAPDVAHFTPFKQDCMRPGG
jgi:hypothetical protein